MRIAVVGMGKIGLPLAAGLSVRELTGVLAHEDDAVVYEIKLGISPGLAAAVGAGSGPSFHFTLNDTVLSDIRIPPQGFTSAAFAAFGGAPVDPQSAGPRYADGQHWDAPTFTLPPSARSVRR